MRIGPVLGAHVREALGLWGRLTGAKLVEPRLGVMRQCVRCGCQWAAMLDGKAIAFAGRSARPQENGDKPMEQGRMRRTVEVDDDMRTLDDE